MFHLLYIGKENALKCKNAILHHKFHYFYQNPTIKNIKIPKSPAENDPKPVSRFGEELFVDKPLITEPVFPLLVTEEPGVAFSTDDVIIRSEFSFVVVQLGDVVEFSFLAPLIFMHFGDETARFSLIVVLSVLPLVVVVVDDAKVSLAALVVGAVLLLVVEIVCVEFLPHSSFDSQSEACSMLGDYINK